MMRMMMMLIHLSQDVQGETAVSKQDPLTQRSDQNHVNHLCWCLFYSPTYCLLYSMSIFQSANQFLCRSYSLLMVLRYRDMETTGLQAYWIWTWCTNEYWIISDFKVQSHYNVCITYANFRKRGQISEKTTLFIGTTINPAYRPLAFTNVWIAYWQRSSNVWVTYL